MQSATAATTAATAAAVALAYLYLKRQQNRVSRENKVVEPLLPGETAPILFGVAPSISAVTFFAGDHSKAANHLRDRVAQIVHASPWLGGWLDRQRGDAAPVLVYDETGRDAPQLFTHEAPGAVALSRDTAYAKMATVLKPLLVKTGAASCGRRDEPQFRVSVVPDAASPATRWALVVSMSHVVADGHTFYQVHNMLSAAAPIVRLRAQRKPALGQAAERAMGGEGGFLTAPSAA